MDRYVFGINRRIKMEMPKQIQDKINQFQGLQNQLQAIVMQKQQFSLQTTEIENAINALKEVDKERVYEAVGPILIEKDKKAADEKLQEQSELIKTRLAMFEKQEKKLTEKLQELSQEIQSGLQGVSKVNS